MSSCLVMIDMQMGFLDTARGYLIDKVCALVKEQQFDHVVATKLKNTKVSYFRKFLSWSGMSGSQEQLIVPKLHKHIDRVFEKEGFTCFTNEFKEYLAESDIDKLYFIGLDTDSCVLKSVLDCFELGIPYEVLVNYCASSGGVTAHQAGLAVMSRNIGGKYLNNEW